MNVRRARKCLAILLLGATIGGVAGAQTPKPWHAGNVQTVETWTRTQKRLSEANTNVWVRPGLSADRALRRVEILCEATGLASGGKTEFLIVGERSEKDYEAMAISFARAGDLCRALEYIGVPRGRPIRPSAFEFWPKGERVLVSVRSFGSDPGAARPVQASLADTRSRPALPKSFVYVGSRWAGDGANAVCLADGATPGSILSTYNEPTTVLDVPTRSPQSDVYGSLVIASDRPFEAGQLLVFAFSPEPRPSGLPRVADVSLDVRCRAGVASNGLAGVEGVLRGPGREVVTNALAGVLEALGTLVRADRDPFVRVTFDDALSLTSARDVARVLQEVEGDGGIRIEAPPAGQLYFRAFLPDSRWRARPERPSQPWELRVGRGPDGAWRGMLVEIVEDWSRADSFTPELQVREHPLAKWNDLPTVLQGCIDAQTAAVRKRLKQNGQAADDERVAQLAGLGRINTLFVFAPADAPLSAFLPAVRLIRAKVPTVYVFSE